jgi:hypothetical protein
MKLDQKTELHFRQIALTQAHATHESQPQRSADETVASAEKFFKFLAGHTMSADSIEIPSPLEIYDNLIEADASVSDLLAIRRIKLLELEVLTNALRTRGHEVSPEPM